MRVRSAILNYLNGATDGVGRRPINDVLEVVSANQVTTPALTVTAYVRSPFGSDAATRIATALTTLIGLLPIGGKKLAGSSVGLVLVADLYAATMAQQGVVNVTFSTGDIVLGQDDVYAGVPVVNVVLVP